MEYLQKLQLERYELFKSQKLDTGRFELTFEIEGKLLHAHRAIITLVSTTLDVMLSERWNGNRDIPIKIVGNRFEDFHGFIHFLYSGSCELNATNIYAMIDIAEFYNVDLFKKYCEEYALKMEYTLENVFLLLKIAVRYSMDIQKEALFKFIGSNFPQFADADEFLSFDKEAMKEIAGAVKSQVEPETLFQVLFKWSEQQANKQQKESDDNFFNLNEAIKLQISPFLPHIQFELMHAKFIVDIAAFKPYLFTPTQVHSMLLQNLEPFKIKVTNSKNGCLTGEIPHYDHAVEAIKALDSDSGYSFLSQIRFKTMLNAPPSKPSQIKKSEINSWYLFYYPNGDIGVNRLPYIYNVYYIICEMFPEKNFSITGDCKIEIYRNAF